MTFLDTGILVGAVLENHPEHKRCLAAFAQYRNCFSDAHALAETFATLTGFYKVPTEIRHRINARLAAETYDSSVHPF